ncbi:integrase, catalytic region, zinc finger, CCHC-type containing protein [Tanacetum coccineum]
MAFVSASFSPRFPQTNNQLRTSSNPRNQATIQDGILTVQTVQGRETPGTGIWLPISQSVSIKPLVPSELVLKMEIPRELPSISMHIICQDVMNTIMHANDHYDNVLPANYNSLDHDNSALDLLKQENDHLIELLISQDLVHTIVNSLAAINDYKYMQQSFVDEYNETLELLVYVSATCPKNVSDKLVVVTPMNMTRRVRVSSSTEASESKPRSNTKKDRIMQTSSSNKKTNKVEDQPRITKYSLNNLNRDSKIVWNANIKHSVLNVNSELICATYHECMFDDIHDKCVSDYLNDVNARVKSKSVKSRSAKSKKKNIWKPTGKVYINVGYSWKPTGRIFTIDGNTCPLTRIISTKVVPLRKSNSTTIVKQTQPSSNKSGKLKDIKNVGSSSKSKTVVQIVLWYLDSGCSKHMTEKCSQLINFVSKFLGIVRFGNDQIAKIMGYDDYQLGNVTISRVYYVEGLGHNLFTVGQLCDLDLEVAFRKHTCYVRSLDGADLLSGSRDTNLYTISLDDMLKSSLICLLSKASKTKSWLWHRRLSHLNFSTLNQLAKQGLV